MVNVAKVKVNDIHYSRLICSSSHHRRQLIVHDPPLHVLMVSPSCAQRSSSRELAPGFLSLSCQGPFKDLGSLGRTLVISLQCNLLGVNMLSIYNLGLRFQADFNMTVRHTVLYLRFLS